jgi:metal-sulfur cluster biosynthetic enzyme
MTLKDKIIEVFKHTLDPEIGIDLWTLGLIYGFELSDDEERLRVKMTFTTPLCPFGPQLIGDLKRSLLGLGLRVVDIEVTFDPPWEPSEELREMLGV